MRKFLIAAAVLAAPMEASALSQYAPHSSYNKLSAPPSQSKSRPADRSADGHQRLVACADMSPCSSRLPCHRWVRTPHSTDPISLYDLHQLSARGRCWAAEP